MTRKQYLIVAGLLLIGVVIFMQTFPEGKSLTRQIAGFFEGIGLLIGGLWAALLPIINLILTVVILLTIIFLPPFLAGFFLRYFGIAAIDRFLSRELPMTTWQVGSLQGLVLFLVAFPWTKLVPSFGGLNVWFASLLSAMGWLRPEIFPILLYLFVLSSAVIGAGIAGGAVTSSRYRSRNW